MSFFSQIEGPVLKILNELLSDDRLAEDLTYHLYDGQAFDDDLEHNVERYTEYEVAGVRLRHSLKSASVASGSMQAGDLFFLFRFSDLPDNVSTLDKIVDANGKEFKIRGIDKVFGLAISISVDGS